MMRLAAALSNCASAYGFCRTALPRTPLEVHPTTLSPVKYITGKFGYLLRAKRATSHPSGPSPSRMSVIRPWSYSLLSIQAIASAPLLYSTTSNPPDRKQSSSSIRMSGSSSTTSSIGSDCIQPAITHYPTLVKPLVPVAGVDRVQVSAWFEVRLD